MGGGQIFLEFSPFTEKKKKTFHSQRLDEAFKIIVNLKFFSFFLFFSRTSNNFP